MTQAQPQGSATWTKVPALPDWLPQLPKSMSSKPRTRRLAP